MTRRAWIVLVVALLLAFPAMLWADDYRDGGDMDLESGSEGYDDEDPSNVEDGDGDEAADADGDIDFDDDAEADDDEPAIEDGDADAAAPATGGDRDYELEKVLIDRNCHEVLDCNSAPGAFNFKTLLLLVGLGLWVIGRRRKEIG